VAKVVVFGFDVAEASQVRRIRNIQALGHEVFSFTMRRDSMNAEFVPDWKNVHLFRTKSWNHLQRLFVIIGSVLKTLPHLKRIAGADVIVARNFDMLVIAWAVRTISPYPRPPLVYECLDIHALFTREDLVGRVMRWCERRLLFRTALVVVSSPGFIRNYFVPVQGYEGATALIENKIWFDDHVVPRPSAPRPRNPGAPIVVGWVGSLRCNPSFRILLGTADKMGDEIEIHLHGIVHRHFLPDFDEAVVSRPNIRYFGPYQYPDGLAEVYRACDVVWAQDLWQRGANSDWLLPNRIYEASWFGCPSIAVAGTETGTRVAEGGLGFVVGEAEASHLVRLLRDLTPEDIDASTRALLAREQSAFRLMPNELDIALQMAIAAAQGRVATLST